MSQLSSVQHHENHPYQYAPQVLKKALMLNLILYIPISEEQFKLIEGKKSMISSLTFAKKFYSEKLTKKTKQKKTS